MQYEKPEIQSQVALEGELGGRRRRRRRGGRGSGNYQPQPV